MLSLISPCKLALVYLFVPARKFASLNAGFCRNHAFSIFSLLLYIDATRTRNLQGSCTFRTEICFMTTSSWQFNFQQINSPPLVTTNYFSAIQPSSTTDAVGRSKACQAREKSDLVGAKFDCIGLVPVQQYSLSRCRDDEIVPLKE